MEAVNRNPSASELRKFGWAMVLGFGIIGTILWYAGPEPNGWRWIGVYQQWLAVGLWSLGLVLPLIAHGPVSLARPVYVGWMTVAVFIGTKMTFVGLSVLYFVLLPIFSLIRLKDPLRMKLLGPGASYWEDHRHHESTLERTSRQF